MFSKLQIDDARVCACAVSLETGMCGRLLAAGVIFFSSTDDHYRSGDQRMTKRRRWVTQLAKVIPDAELRRVQLLPALLMLFEPPSSSLQKHHELGSSSSLPDSSPNLYILTAQQPVHQQALLLRGAAIILLRQWALLADEALLLLRRLLRVERKPFRASGGLSTSGGLRSSIPVNNGKKGESFFARGVSFHKQIGARRKRARTSSPKQPQLLANNAKPWEINPESQQSEIVKMKELAYNQASYLACDVTTFQDGGSRSFAEIGQLFMQQYFQGHDSTPKLGVQEERHESTSSQQDRHLWSVRPCQEQGIVGDHCFEALWNGYRSSGRGFRRAVAGCAFESSRGTEMPAGKPLADAQTSCVPDLPSPATGSSEAEDASNAAEERASLAQDKGADAETPAKDGNEVTITDQPLPLQDRKRDAHASKCRSGSPRKTLSGHCSRTPNGLKSIQKHVDWWGTVSARDQRWCYNEEGISADEVEIPLQDYCSQAECFRPVERSIRDGLFSAERNSGEAGFAATKKNKTCSLRKKQQTSVRRKVSRITFDTKSLFPDPPGIAAAFGKLVQTHVATSATATEPQGRAEDPTFNALLRLPGKPSERVHLNSFLLRGAVLCLQRRDTADPWLRVLASEVDECNTNVEQGRVVTSSSSSLAGGLGTTAEEMWESWQRPWALPKGLRAEYHALQQRKAKNIDDNIFPLPAACSMDVDTGDFDLPLFDDEHQLQGLLSNRPLPSLLSITSEVDTLDSTKRNKGMQANKSNSSRSAEYAAPAALERSNVDRRNDAPAEASAYVLRGFLDADGLFTQRISGNQATSTPLARCATDGARAKPVNSPRFRSPQRREGMHHSPSCLSSTRSDVATAAYAVGGSGYVKEPGGTTDSGIRRTSCVPFSILERGAQLQQTEICSNEESALNTPCCHNTEQTDITPRKDCFYVGPFRADAPSLAHALSAVSSPSSLTRGGAVCGHTSSTSEKFMQFVLITLKGAVQANTRVYGKLPGAARNCERVARSQELQKETLVKVSFNHLVPVDCISSATAARAFHHLLVLHTRGRVTLQQEYVQEKRLSKQRKQSHPETYLPPTVSSLFVCVKRDDILSSAGSVGTGNSTPRSVTGCAWEGGYRDEDFTLQQTLFRDTGADHQISGAARHERR